MIRYLKSTFGLQSILKFEDSTNFNNDNLKPLLISFYISIFYHILTKLNAHFTFYIANIYLWLL